jgi:hypothetical protein
LLLDCIPNWKTKTQAKPNLAPRKTAAPETDNNFNMESTWKVATRPRKSRSQHKPSNAEPKKQPKKHIAATRKSHPPIRQHPKSRNAQNDPKPKPKKQPKTQTATPESRNFHGGKSRNLKFKQKSTLKKPENSETQSETKQAAPNFFRKGCHKA